jgi:uncharacterized protein (DUF302 family)
MQNPGLQNPGPLVVRRSRLEYADTIDHLLKAITRRGLTVFARIDHAAAARQVGMELAAEEVVLLGNPRAGTPLMQRDRHVGIDLPLRILLWQENGAIFLGYKDPRELAGQYDLADHKAALDAMAALLGELVGEAA